MIEHILQSIGLTRYETKVYLALLENGESTSGKILTRARINSGKIYEILESLKNKGLVSEITKNKIKHFIPAQPNQVLDYLSEKKSSIEKQELEFKKAIPLLMQKIDLVKQPTHIEVYTGFKGMKTAFMKEVSAYKKGKTVRVLGVLSYNRYKMEKKYLDFFTYTVEPARERAKVTVLKINDESARSITHLQAKQADIRYIKYPSCMSINVYGNLSILAIFSESPIFISIESKEVAESFRTSFDALWKIAKK